ncbi:MAG: glycosyltransferase [Dissulfurispiraceae bacterium]
MTNLFKADLHVHSRFSNKPSIWALRKLNCPESYTTPESIYKAALKNGMDFVTITDHNTINGALEIAHLPKTFISSEITTYLPEDGCKMHVVALGISEHVFNDIMHLRKNIYELAAYLRSNQIAHYIAHPLYDMNSRISADTIEKLVLLFEVFEVKNGSRSHRYGNMISGIIASLTPEKIASLADRHGITPRGESPWIKGSVGGSDDHSGFFIARAYTVSPCGASVSEFVSSISDRLTRASGDDGDVMTLAHSIYGIGYHFLKEKIDMKKSSSLPFISALMKQVMNTNQGGLPLFDRLQLFVRKNIPEIYTGYEGRTFEEIIDREARMLLNDSRFLADISSESINRRIFTVTSCLLNRLSYVYTDRAIKTLSAMSVMNLAYSLSGIGFIHLLASPYYLAFHHQHRSKDLLAELEKRFLSANESHQPQKVALFTDTLHEINGVAITIKRLMERAKREGVELVVITSSSEETSFKDGIMNFKSFGMFALPEYPDLKLHFPPILDIMDYVEREGFTRFHVSTPGTIGIVSLLIAKVMDIPISGTYHTDIPQYVSSLTNDAFLESIAWNYMIWFYNLMEEVMVPSASTQKQLIDRGLVADKVRPLPRWVDTEVFTPVKRDPYLWTRHGLDGSVRFLYVGRVSREKNLEYLSQAFTAFIDSGMAGNLIVVGDGPYRKEMEAELKGYPVVFTGFLAGEELCAAYASSDVFIFPSTTDTFGNVVLEAQASGIPVIVSSEGGPKELMQDGITGLTITAHSRQALTDAMRFFVEDRNLISIMGQNARHFAEINGIDAHNAYSTILKNDVHKTGQTSCPLKQSDLETSEETASVTA